jgi:hypothetical protein
MEFAAALQEVLANNALTCPAVFWLVEEMKKQSVPCRRRGRRRR